jgi:hypothetical protein
MHSVTVQDGVGPAIVGAIIAASGYVGKLVVDVVLDFRKRERDRRSQLVELRSLLRTAKTSFIIQNQHATRLLSMLRQSDPQSPVETVGYERMFASKYVSFFPEQKELHDIIRGITIHALKPTNTAILNWIQRDAYFRGQRRSEQQIGSLPECLSDLHTHLLLWLAKYETWIPDKPEHALVYLDDEQKHGVGFPKQLDGLVERVLSDM